MKQCNKCKEYKHLSDFNKDSSRKDGYSYRCRACEQSHYYGYYPQNRDVRLVYQERTLAHKKEYMRQYQRDHPEVAIAGTSKRRTRLQNCEQAATAEQLIYLVEYYNYLCLCCGIETNFTRYDPASLHFDHIVPVCIGGCSNIENMQPLCQRCNQTRSKKEIQDFRPYWVAYGYPLIEWP